eukprot:2911110-Pyramimonas_sp.AAC.1
MPTTPVIKRQVQKRRPAKNKIPTVIILNKDIFNATLALNITPIPRDWAGLMINSENPLIIGTDCAGLCSIEQGLERSRLARHVVAAFASEKDEKTRFVLAKNFAPGALFGDICERSATDAPQVHFYNAGFPCQPFSAEGGGGGWGLTTWDAKTHEMHALPVVVPKGQRGQNSWGRSQG